MAEKPHQKKREFLFSFATCRIQIKLVYFWLKRIFLMWHAWLHLILVNEMGATSYSLKAIHGKMNAQLIVYSPALNWLIVVVCWSI